MAMGFDNSNSVRHIYERQDADGKIYVWARAHGALTAKAPYLVYAAYDGYRTAALFDTGLASTTAAGSQGFYKIGIANEAVGSDVDGWLQVGGFCATANTSLSTATVGLYLRWVDAAIASGTAARASAAACVDAFAVNAVAAASATYQGIFLLNKYVIGTT